MRQPVVDCVLDGVSGRRADSLAELVVEKLELVLDLCLGPAAHFAANAPSVSAKPQGDRAAPPALAARGGAGRHGSRRRDRSRSSLRRTRASCCRPRTARHGTVRHGTARQAHGPPSLAPMPSLIKIDMCSELVGMAGFEPAASCSQSRRANQAAPHPVEPNRSLPADRSRSRRSRPAGHCPTPVISERFGPDAAKPVRCRCSPGAGHTSHRDARA